MYRFLILTLLLATFSLQAAEDATWRTDFKAAVAEATKSKKPLLLNFTGSDWCGWCKRLKKEVFDTAEFKTWAAKSVVLVEVDFPQAKAQSKAEKKQNEELAKHFSIEGYPTIVLLDAGGTKKLGQLGYMKGGPAVWTAEADKALMAK